MFLKHHTEAALFRCQGEARTRRFLTIDQDTSGGQWLEAGNGAQGGGFAAAGRAKQTGNLTRLKRKADVADHRLIVVMAGNAFELQQRGSHQIRIRNR